MSTEKKDKKTVLTTLLALVTGYESKAKGIKITALDLTTKEGDKIVFPDVADGELPKAGDTATIDGEPVISKTVTIVDNDGEFTITFDENGKVVQEQTDEQKEIEALKQENAELKQNFTAMVEEFKSTISALQGDEETDDSADTKPKNENGSKTVTASLDDRLAKLKEKKEKSKRGGTII